MVQTCPRVSRVGVGVVVEMSAPPPRRTKTVLQRDLKDCTERISLVESRMDKVELGLEQADAYRRLRLEHCPAAMEVWQRFERKEIEPGNLRTNMSTAVEGAVREALGKEVDEEALKEKAAGLSGGKRMVPTLAVRQQLAAEFRISELLEWIHKDRSGGFGLVLRHGEASRALHTAVRNEINWSLFVLSRMANPPVGVQLYPDRGPRTRAKGQGKGRGGGKGKDGKGKGGKGKGKKGGKAKADRAGDVEMES